MNGDTFLEPALNEYGERDSSIIPFEHAILDIALSAVVKRLRYATDKLDANRQIVDQLTSNVDRETLVSVRMLKNEQQELLERVAVVLECLEHTAGPFSSLRSISHEFQCSLLRPVHVQYSDTAQHLIIRCGWVAVLPFRSLLCLYRLVPF